ncbi:precorrin-3B synthase [Oryzihumus leptocrescens]|uniref:Precorrin-3B synthase n=1 Tax=Oryzihumus leptocrescens TaxID=297536 RepID=A0A542ZIK7_9MICO|nr:precorrin-3B synthase [Oryzihumus leptocrescens]
MANPPTLSRGRPDRCPGAVRLHHAEDGSVARIRVPGGLLRADQIDEIVCAATELGDGSIEVTSRGNLQLRGLPPSCGGDLAARLYAVGLLPSVAHDRARNVLLSPLSGLDGRGLADLTSTVPEYDEILCGTAALALLSGRFLVAFDDGRHDVAALDADVTLVARAERVTELLLAGLPTGLTVAAGDAARCAATAAEVFLVACATAGADSWRVRDLVSSPLDLLDPVRALLADRAIPHEHSDPGLTPSASPRQGPALGVVRSQDGPAALSVAAPLGRAPAASWQALVALARTAVGDLRLTPWRGIVIPGVDAAGCTAGLASLASAGFVTNARSPRAGVTACAGRTGCAKSLADVHADAEASFGAAQKASGTTLLPLHWSGCERRCGHPTGARVEVVAQPGGHYVIERHDAADPPTTTALTAGASPQALAGAVSDARRTP